MRTDEQLVQVCRQGDARAWEELVRRHQDRILNLAYQFTGNREEARDLAQEIFVRLYRKIDRYDSSRSFKTWFNSLARNLCIDHYRQKRSQPSIHGTPVDEMGTLAAPVESPHRRAERRSESEFLMRAMDRLGEASREALVLKELQGHSIEEVAAMLELPVGTVKSRLFRARLELAQTITRMRHAVSNAGGSVGL